MVTVAQVQNIGYMLTTYSPGVRVPIVMKGSAADRYGVRPGDVVLALDDQVVAPGMLPSVAMRWNHCKGAANQC